MATLEAREIRLYEAWDEDNFRRVPDSRHVTRRVSRVHVSKLSSQQVPQVSISVCQKIPKIVHLYLASKAINGFDGAAKCSFHHFKVSI